MHLSSATAAIILAAVPAVAGYAVSSTTRTNIYTSISSSMSSTTSSTLTSTPTLTTVSSTTSSSSSVLSSTSSSFSSSSSSPSSSSSLSSISISPPTSSSGFSTITSTSNTLVVTTSYDTNESTAECPVATSLPACATACIRSAAIVIGCAQQSAMHHCQCLNFSALSDNATPCIIGACGMDKALEARSVGLAICSSCEGIYS